MRSVCILVALAVILPACTGKQTAPTRVEAENRRVAGPGTQTKTESSGLLGNPDKDPPPPRAGEQLAPEALEQALQKAREQLKAGETYKAMATLRTCANKLELDFRCEAELGILLAGLERHRAEARYYLNAVATLDDPKADAEMFRRLGEAMQKQGMHRQTGDVYQRMIDHGATTAADYALLSRGLQFNASRLQEAADALAKARALDPSVDKWTYEEGLLRAQVAGQSAQAAALLRTYLDKTRGQDPELDNVLEARIAELSGLGKIEDAAKPPQDPAAKAPTPLVQ